MNPTTIPTMSSSPPNSMDRRMSTKMGNNKASTVHTRSPRSRYSLTYADWITRALMAAKDKCACLSDIYEWMSFNVPGLQEQRFLHSSKGWKNAVRHTLSINPRFQKLKRLGKPALWTLSEEYLRQAQALTKISMSIAPRRDSNDSQSVQMAGSNGPMDASSMDTGAPASSSPQSKICYVGKSTMSPDNSYHAHMGELMEPKAGTSFGARVASLTQEAYRNSALLDQYRNSNFLATTNTVSTSASIPTPGLIQACDAAAAANRAAFLSDLSALASLNALITANNESIEAMDPLRHRFSAMAAAETAALAAAAAHQLGSTPSSVAATPPLMNFFTPSANSPFNSVSRRGSGDSGISTISNSSNGSTASTLGSGNMVSEPLRPFTQSLDVTTLSGLEATLVLPRPLPIQCLTDHKLLLASLIWPNPAAGFFTN